MMLVALSPNALTREPTVTRTGPVIPEATDSYHQGDKLSDDALNCCHHSEKERMRRRHARGRYSPAEASVAGAGCDTFLATKPAASEGENECA